MKTQETSNETPAAASEESVARIANAFTYTVANYVVFHIVNAVLKTITQKATTSDKVAKDSTQEAAESVWGGEETGFECSMNGVYLATLKAYKEVDVVAVDAAKFICKEITKVVADTLEKTVVDAVEESTETLKSLSTHIMKSVSEQLIEETEQEKLKETLQIHKTIIEKMEEVYDEEIRLRKRKR